MQYFKVVKDDGFYWVIVRVKCEGQWNSVIFFLFIDVIHIGKDWKKHYQQQIIDHFTVVYLVAWSLNENEGGGDLVLIETSLLFLSKLPLINMRTASLT